MSVETDPEVKENVSIGRTETGKQFIVPQTHDMLHNLFSKFPPTFSSHTLLEFFTLSLCSFQFLLFFYLLLTQKLTGGWRLYFLSSFLFWRFCYNAGLGWVLKRQSESKWLTQTLKPFFDQEEKNYKRVRGWLKLELSKKMAADYDFDQLPLEFNIWLLFRNLVDLILMNDFCAYLVFCLTFTQLPVEWSALDLVRYVGGLFLIAFNIWVKFDAHRVVKDFAWYWGDFFFLLDKDLSFDGVFEMAPHPMYSLGYAGYYGLSMISNSYIVLIVSILAHAMQFLFLYWVEEPHIQKTYGQVSTPLYDRQAMKVLYGSDHAYFGRDLIVFKNLDLFRANDFFLVLIFSGTLLLGLPFLDYLGLQLPNWFFIAQAVLWRLFHSFGLGFVLRQQSLNKFWTRHFQRHGESTQEAFSHWKSLYNLSLTMTHTTFILAAFKCFQMPLDWQEVYGTFLSRQIMGLLLILLHIWMSFSVFEVLRDFGWFYGDFFIEELQPDLHYTGIYRYLNNPEKSLGNSSFWGLALMSGSLSIFIICVFSHLSNWLFLEYVEGPHMQKIYGSKIRKESGFEKTIKNQLKPLEEQLGRLIN